MTVAVLGAGVMGETVVSGLLRAGRSPAELLVSVRRSERGDELRERYGVDVVTNLEAAAKADTLVLGVKPQDMPDLLDEIAPATRPGQLVMSLAAGITTASIESRLPGGVAVVRVMPNTPALVDEGMSAISRGSHCDEAHLLEAEELMGATGRVVRVPEKQQDAVTAISGTGPAYLFFVVEAMIEAGVISACRGPPPPSSSSRRWWARRSCCARPASTRQSCASGSPRPEAPLPRPSASLKTTRCVRRSWSPSRAPATARGPSPAESRTDRFSARPRRPPRSAALDAGSVRDVVGTVARVSAPSFVETTADAARRRGLRRMRAVALTLLLIAAAVFAATLHAGGGWAYVHATAEAAMVGAIADWFAVTALFGTLSGCRSRTRRSSRPARTSWVQALATSWGPTSCPSPWCGTGCARSGWRPGSAAG